MSTKTFQIALGLNDKDTKLQKYSTVEVYKVVTNLIAHASAEAVYLRAAAFTVTRTAATQS